MFSESGDTLILYELDRLGRNKKDIIDELRYYEDHDIRVMFLDIPTSTIDLSEESNSMNKLITDTINKVVIEIYAMQAETELQRKEKKGQREGIEAKKARGDWDDYGRHRVMSAEEFAKQYKK